MEKIKAAVIGYGNVGKYVVDALLSAEDFDLRGIVGVRKAGMSVQGFTIVDNISKLGDIDVAILATPSRSVPKMAKELLAMGISTIDSFDIHGDIPALRAELGAAAKAANAVSVLSAGWDPGSDSIVRTLLEALVPRGMTHTNFGPGMSMGHTVAVKAIAGVEDALSITEPMGSGIHRRMVYVSLKKGADFAAASAAIKSDPYFVHDETHVNAVDDISAIADVAHGVLIERCGSSSGASNQRLSFSMKINNPALTAQILVASARAATRLSPGAYTMIEIPPVDFLPGSRESAVARLV